MKKLLLLVAVVGGAGIASKGCLSKSAAPDEQLADRLQDLCEIARANVKTPNDGVTALGKYAAEHAGDAYKHVVDTVAMLVQIEDQKKHDARADKAKERWSETVEGCIGDWMEFFDAVENDPIAVERLDRFEKRLQRTLDYIFSGEPGGSMLRNAPLRLQRYLTTSFQPAPSVPSPVPPPGASYEK